MRFTQYTSAAAFSDEVTDILMKNEIQNNLFFLNIRGGDEGTDASKILMATVKDDTGAIVLTAVGTPPYPTLLYETDNIPNDEALECFTTALVKNGIVIGRVMAEKELAERFCVSYGMKTGKSYKKHESLVLYVLESVNNLSLPDGRLRKADQSDSFYLPYWLADFVLVCHLGDYDLNSSVLNAKRLVEDEKVFVWEDKFPVSAAASTRQTKNSAFISHVYTPPHFRGKGYGTACVAALSQKLFDDGWKYCALYADCANPYSNKVYQKIGYKAFFYYDQYLLT